MAEITVRPIEAEEFDAYARLDDVAFAQPPTHNVPPDWARDELDRAYGAFDGTELVGNGRLYSFELTLPGGTLARAGAVSWIAVSPTHRRRGILRQMMAALHRDAHERGEPLTMLTASESAIYGRFGYGIATWRMGITLQRAHAALAQPAAGGALGGRGAAGEEGTVRLIELAGATTVLSPIYDQARRARPGMVSRPPSWWSSVYTALTRDVTAFVALHERSDGQADGFALYRIDRTWDRGVPTSTLTVLDLQAVTAGARVALWRYLLGIDLVATIAADNVPVDDPLRFLLADPRRMRVEFVNDMAWVRLGDPLAALRARAYPPGAESLVIEAHDAAGGSVRAQVGPDGVRRSRSRAGLVTGLAELGAIYLGGTSCTQLAQAGRVEEVEPGAATRADRLFASSPPPATLSSF